MYEALTLAAGPPPPAPLPGASCSQGASPSCSIMAFLHFIPAGASPVDVDAQVQEIPGDSPGFVPVPDSPDGNAGAPPVGAFLEPEEEENDGHAAAAAPAAPWVWPVLRRPAASVIRRQVLKGNKMSEDQGRPEEGGFGGERQGQGGFEEGVGEK